MGVFQPRPVAAYQPAKLVRGPEKRGTPSARDADGGVVSKILSQSHKSVSSPRVAARFLWYIIRLGGTSRSAGGNGTRWWTGASRLLMSRRAQQSRGTSADE